MVWWGRKIKAYLKKIITIHRCYIGQGYRILYKALLKLEK